MNAPRTTLHGQDTTITGSLYVAFELGDRSWKLSLGDGVRAPSCCTVAAGDIAAVFTAIAKAKARCHLATDAPVRSCYEAGRDGFWLHRCLEAHRITNLVVDSASIEVNRRRRRAKTDRLDSDKLLSMSMRYHAGERRVWAVARIPTPQQEDERRLHRELNRLRQERTAHTNRIRSQRSAVRRMPSAAPPWKIAPRAARSAAPESSFDNQQLAAAVRAGSPSLPGKTDSICAHTSSLSNVRITLARLRAALCAIESTRKRPRPNATRDARRRAAARERTNETGLKSFGDVCTLISRTCAGAAGGCAWLGRRVARAGGCAGQDTSEQQENRLWS
ncbi:hypothetical protein [Burkholderia ubonensis]|uniref:hypothetical protein n=1 Tax=Burkholderia ubonensis TaxID=101571 RepID=UPI000A4DC784|nr:hypothetical protein [Burkholderia ubonensis]